MHTVILSTDELKMLLCALEICTPSGGGSAEFTLLRRLNTDTGVDCGDDMRQRYANVVLESAEEAGVITWNR
jgi:hypothetical protein